MDPKKDRLKFCWAPEHVVQMLYALEDAITYKEDQLEKYQKTLDKAEDKAIALETRGLTEANNGQYVTAQATVELYLPKIEKAKEAMATYQQLKKALEDGLKIYERGWDI